MTWRRTLEPLRIPRAAKVASVLALFGAGCASVHAQMQAPSQVGDVVALPDGFREWVFVGAPVTPNALNGGAAAFPEFHHVYVEPKAYTAFKETGEFPEGTTIVKELVSTQTGTHADGSRDEASGRGYFAHAFGGIDMMVKDSARYAETSGWGFFNYGHHAPPYAETAEAQPQEACAYCHEASATHDMVFTTFYPILGEILAQR